MIKQNDYNESDILYTLMSYVNVSSSQDMYYTIADTVLNNIDQIPDISIKELARMSYTSPATISRFSKDLDCESFADFKKQLRDALEIASDEVHFDRDDLKEIKDHPQTLVSKVFNDTRRSLKQAEDGININDIDRICALIHNAKTIHMFGYQFSKIVSTDFQLKMLKLKKFIYVFVNRGDEIQKLDTIEKDELVIILSVRARDNIMDPLIEKIKERGPRILLITMNKYYTNPLVDYYYHLQGFESNYTQSSMMGSVNFTTFFNCIYTRYGILYDETIND